MAEAVAHQLHRFEKAFDSIHQESLWRILRAYGIPQQIVLVIKSFYNNFKCRVGNSKSSFGVKTSVRQGCPMSALLFNLTIDWVMWQTTLSQWWVIRWTLFSTLKDLDFANDLVLVSHTLQHIQENTIRLRMFTQQIVLKISQKKIEMMMLDVPNPSPVKVNGKDLPTTNEFTYLESSVKLVGGEGSDIRNRPNKASNVFRMLNNVWKSSSTKTKWRLSPSYVLSILLCGSECWRMTESDLNKLSIFHT